ncbi:MAG: hypothetical protein H6741_29765 [Alphaproteobacteria bacterium]|nr:hypothetical protein [Alphaproteobacteria bacterium]MCB9796910.1 hypothetical protein [Alphaproteobacteria bacterium]
MSSLVTTTCLLNGAFVALQPVVYVVAEIRPSSKPCAALVATQKAWGQAGSDATEAGGFM